MASFLVTVLISSQKQPSIWSCRLTNQLGPGLSGSRFWFWFIFSSLVPGIKAGIHCAMNSGAVVLLSPSTKHKMYHYTYSVCIVTSTQRLCQKREAGHNIQWQMFNEVKRLQTFHFSFGKVTELVLLR